MDPSLGVKLIPVPLVFVGEVILLTAQEARSYFEVLGERME